MTADERRGARAADPGGHAEATLKSSAADPTPTANSSDKSPPGPTTTKNVERHTHVGKQHDREFTRRDDALPETPALPWM